MTLDSLPIGRRARVTAIDWSLLEPDEVTRLQGLGIEVGARLAVAHRGGGLPSYPHPRLMPDFWEFPTVSMGLGPMNAIYQARFNHYLHDRGLKDTSDQHVWAFLGDGEMDEPESRGLIQVAANEALDNLTFVINCNLQRLDGPVRGNGKIIQELESFFRGAGWNVIKVVWGREWDALLHADKDGALVNLMNVTPDGDYQTYKANDGAYVRDHFFGRDPRTKALVDPMTDQEIWNLKRGGHDYRKLYAAYRAAMEHKGDAVTNRNPLQRLILLLQLADPRLEHAVGAAQLRGHLIEQGEGLLQAVRYCFHWRTV